jgi:hypothetical protein
MGRLVRRLEVEFLDIGDAELQERIDEARVIIECFEEPMRQTGQQESYSRRLAADYAMESIGAYRRSEPLREPTVDYVHTREFVLDFIARWEADRN